MRRSRGFTLIELMVVIAIVAILVTLTISVTKGDYSGNPHGVADSVNEAVIFARQRAVANRRYHRIEVQPDQVIVWQWSQFGMATPTGACPPNCWQYLQRISIPNDASIWDAQSTVCAAAGTCSVSQNGSLDFDIDLRPDGSSTGGSIFITNRAQNVKYRVLVYQATGSSYARQNW